jgi:hypothetical protein
VLDKSCYEIKEISYQLAMETVIANHYLHRKAPCSHAYGLYREGLLLGVITYGVSASSTLLRGICGDSEKQNVYELTRLWVDDQVPKNGESFLIGNTIKLLNKEIIVSYADSSHNHLGIVYQATNFIYTGLSAKFRDPKVKGLEHQHHATYAKGLSNKEVIEKFGIENVYFVERPRKHRYIYFNASKTRRKQLLKLLRYPILDYPKDVTNLTKIVGKTLPKVLTPHNL